MRLSFSGNLRLLPRSEATACRLLYVEGMSYAETAESLGCSKGHLSRLHTDAMARLRRVHGEALADRQHVGVEVAERLDPFEDLIRGVPQLASITVVDRGIDLVPTQRRRRRRHLESPQ